MRICQNSRVSHIDYHGKKSFYAGVFCRFRRANKKCPNDCEYKSVIIQDKVKGVNRK